MRNYLCDGHLLCQLLEHVSGDVEGDGLALLLQHPGPRHGPLHGLDGHMDGLQDRVPAGRRDGHLDRDGLLDWHGQLHGLHDVPLPTGGKL